MANTAENKPRITAAEYYSVTAGRADRTELLDGEIVSLASPGRMHQRIAGRLFALADGFIRKQGGTCEANQAIDVQLGDENVVVPDFLVVCDRSKLNAHGCIGAPDWVIEITSMNRSSDFDHKLYLYRLHGVREYWIVDTLKEKVWVYHFEQHPNVVGFYDWNDPIPVGIFGGALTVCIADLL